MGHHARAWAGAVLLRLTPLPGGHIQLPQVLHGLAHTASQTQPDSSASYTMLLSRFHGKDQAKVLDRDIQNMHASVHDAVQAGHLALECAELLQLHPIGQAAVPRNTGSVPCVCSLAGCATQMLSLSVNACP